MKNLEIRRGFGYKFAVAGKIPRPGLATRTQRRIHRRSFLLGGFTVSSAQRSPLGALRGRPQGLPEPLGRFANPRNAPFFVFGDAAGVIQKSFQRR